MSELMEIARRAAAMPLTTRSSRDLMPQNKVRAFSAVEAGGRELGTGASRPLPVRELSPLDILCYLRSGGVPVLHSRIMQEMTMRGFPKEACRKMVQYLQHSHQIEHNLKDGYVLCEEPTL